MKLSVIVPAYNEEASLPKFYHLLLKEIINSVDDSYELIIVNDGSTDSTLNILRDISKQNHRLRVINLSKNFGKEIATTAGIFYASGDAIIVLDADGQHPPELIPKFIKAWKDGSQVVVGIRKSNQKEGFIKHYGSKLFYKLLNAISTTDLMPGTTDYCLIDREVQEVFMQFSEKGRITRGLINWMGFEKSIIPFHAKERIGGKASYKTSKLIKLAVNSFMSLSVVPLFIIGYVGAFITLISFFMGLFIIIEQIILSDPLKLHITGTAMLSVLILFLIGIVLLSQGLIAMYLSRVHTQTQNRPLYIIDKRNSINLS